MTVSETIKYINVLVAIVFIAEQRLEAWDEPSIITQTGETIASLCASRETLIRTFVDLF